MLLAQQSSPRYVNDLNAIYPDARYLPNVEMHFNCPQALYGLDSHCLREVPPNKVAFLYPKELTCV